jgi:hypothetical protein
MKKKILLSIMAFVMTMALAGGATFALFTSTASNAGKDFSAGTVNISDGGNVLSGDVVISNMAPGDSKAGILTVNNTSSLPIYVKITANKSGTIFDGAFAATVVPDGTIAPFSWIPVPANTPYTFGYTVKLPIDATVQSETGTLSFAIDAVQQAHNYQASWTGTWNTNGDGQNYGQLVLVQTGNSVDGSGGPGPNHITGTVSGNTLTGSYNNGTGLINFTIILNGNSFTGTWNDPNGTHGTWNGTR